MLAALRQLAESIVGRVHQFVGPGGEILDPQRDRLLVPVPAERTTGAAINCVDRQGPRLCDVTQGKIR